MSDRAERWLPSAALSDHKLAEAIDAIVRVWAEEWFHAPLLTRTGQDCDARPAPHVSAEFLKAHTLTLYLSEIDQVSLGAAMLGLCADSSEPGDIDVLTGLARTAGEALLARVGAQLVSSGHDELAHSTPREPRREDVIRFDIAFESPRLTLVLEMPRFQAVEARCLLAARFKEPPVLTNPIGALSDIAVELGALVGSAELTVPEIGNLGPGDVIVLDKCVDAPIELEIDRTIKTNLMCLLQPDADRLQLALINPTAS